MKQRRIALEIKKLVNQFKRRILEMETRIDGAAQPTEMQREVIGFLFEHIGKQDVYQRNIEEEFNIRRPTATSILQRMEKNGMIVREADTADARWKRIILTDKSIRIVYKIGEELRLFEKAITRGIPKKDLDTFFAVLDQINQNMR